MDEYESLSHSKWECKCHVVFIPKCRRKVLYVGLGRHLGEIPRKLSEHKESRIEEGHLLADHGKRPVEAVLPLLRGSAKVIGLMWSLLPEGCPSPDRNVHPHAGFRLTHGFDPSQCRVQEPSGQGL
jgi:putative transposase